MNFNFAANSEIFYKLNFNYLINNNSISTIIII